MIFSRSEIAGFSMGGRVCAENGALVMPSIINFK